LGFLWIFPAHGGRVALLAPVYNGSVSDAPFLPALLSRRDAGGAPRSAGILRLRRKSACCQRITQDFDTATEAFRRKLNRQTGRRVLKLLAIAYPSLFTRQLRPSAHPAAMSLPPEALLRVDPAAERRHQPRPRALKKGTIIFRNGSSTFDCLIRNLAGGGAMLVVGDSTGIPDRFDLRFEATPPVRHATVRWRRATALGVSFDDAQPPASAAQPLGR
jgi:hypothetical protein